MIKCYDGDGVRVSVSCQSMPLTLTSSGAERKAVPCVAPPMLSDAATFRDFMYLSICITMIRFLSPAVTLISLGWSKTQVFFINTGSNHSKATCFAVKGLVGTLRENDNGQDMFHGSWPASLFDVAWAMHKTCQGRGRRVELQSSGQFLVQIRHAPK